MVPLEKVAAFTGGLNAGWEVLMVSSEASRKGLRETGLALLDDAGLRGEGRL